MSLQTKLRINPIPAWQVRLELSWARDEARRDQGRPGHCPGAGDWSLLSSQQLTRLRYILRLWDPESQINMWCLEAWRWRPDWLWLTCQFKTPTAIVSSGSGVITRYRIIVTMHWQSRAEDLAPVKAKQWTCAWNHHEIFASRANRGRLEVIVCSVICSITDNGKCWIIFVVLWNGIICRIIWGFNWPLFSLMSQSLKCMSTMTGMMLPSWLGPAAVSVHHMFNSKMKDLI